MEFFNPFGKRRPTPEQEARLALITDSRQRAILLRCIARGEHIPEFAWRPLPQLTSNQISTLADLSRDVRGRAEARGMPADEYVASMVAYDAPDLMQRGADRLNAARYLIDPVPGLEPLDAVADDDIIPLLGWGFFDPAGPMIVTVALRLQVEERQFVLQLSRQHPFAPVEVGYAFLPLNVACYAETVIPILEELFRQNGSSRFPVMSRRLPSHVLIFPDGMLTPDQTRELFFLLIPHAKPENLTETALRLHTWSGKPWERSEVEAEAARREELKGASEQHRRAIGWPPSRQAAEAWWRCVTDDVHVRAELAQMGTAWERAVVGSRTESVKRQASSVRAEPAVEAELDFAAHYRAMSLERLKEVAKAPAKSFRMGAWEKLQSEIRRPEAGHAPEPRKEEEQLNQRRQSDGGGARPKTSDVPAPGDHRLNWQRVARAAASGMDATTLHRLTANVIQTDPRFAAFRQPGYPNDARVSFPAFHAPMLSKQLGDKYQGAEMWVRLLVPGPDQDEWIGRLLNAPVDSSALKKDDYVVVACTGNGLIYRKKVTAVGS